MNGKAVVFDLDGTLLDTLEDLAVSMNTALDKMGLPVWPIDRYKVFVGDGVEVLAQRVLPRSNADSSTVKECVMLMRDEYAKRWSEKTQPYDGIKELLHSLLARKIRLAVLSNKPDDFTKEMVSHFFKDVFEMVIGGGVFPKKPDSTAPLHIANAMKIAPSEFLYVGDTDTDMKTAVQSGMYPVGVLWGFRSAQELLENGAKTLIKHPLDLLSIGE